MPDLPRGTIKNVVLLTVYLPNKRESKPMNTIIYIVGLVVIIGVVLSYLGLR